MRDCRLGTNDTRYLTCYAALVVLETPHPRGPVFRQNAAGPCPGPCRVKLVRPLERPKLFESDLAYGPVQEKAVNAAVVPVDTEICYITA